MDENLIVVYSNYASDERGAYDYLLGAPVSSLDEIPDGMTYRKVAAGPYALFATQRGRVEVVVPEEWAKIWEQSPAALGGVRSFVTDYEVYDRRGADRNQAKVAIHVGLKPARR